MRKHFLFAPAIVLVASLSACEAPPLEQGQIANLQSAYADMEPEQRVYVKKALRYAGINTGGLSDAWTADMVPALTQAADLLSWDEEVQLDSEAGAARFLSQLASVKGRQTMANGISDPEAPWVLVEALDEVKKSPNECTVKVGRYERFGETAVLSVYVRRSDNNPSGQGGVAIEWDGWQGRIASQFYGLHMDTGTWPSNGSLDHLSPTNAALVTYNDNWSNIFRLMEGTDTLAVKAGNGLDPVDPFLFEQGNFRGAAQTLKGCFGG